MPVQSHSSQSIIKDKVILGLQSQGYKPKYPVWIQPASSLQTQLFRFFCVYKFLTLQIALSICFLTLPGEEVMWQLAFVCEQNDLKSSEQILRNCWWNRWLHWWFSEFCILYYRWKPQYVEKCATWSSSVFWVLFYLFFWHSGKTLLHWLHFCILRDFIA